MMARSILAFAFAAWFTAAPADVKEVQITPSGAQTQITVVVGNTDVSVHHFMLAEPPRLILDVEGASHALARHSYEAIGRGGVIRMRSSQFRLSCGCKIKKPPGVSAGQFALEIPDGFSNSALIPVVLQPSCYSVSIATAEGHARIFLSESQETFVSQNWIAVRH